jgi:hypothetical protein
MASNDTLEGRSRDRRVELGNVGKESRGAHHSSASLRIFALCSHGVYKGALVNSRGLAM